MSNKTNKIKDETLDQVSGGSFYIQESEANLAGVYLLNEDGTPGEFGYFYNTGDYYFQGKKISSDDASTVVAFYRNNKRRAESLEEAKTWQEGIVYRPSI